MDRQFQFYSYISSMCTSAVVLIVSCITLWQKALFWESIIWQSIIIFAILLVTNIVTDKGRGPIKRLAFWLILPLVFALSWRVPVDVFFIYTIVWICSTPFFLPTRQCWLWLVAVNILWYVMRQHHWQEAQPLVETLLISTFFVFGLLAAISAKESAEANDTTQKLNRELLATQHLLGEASRESERIRIARDLHDLLGHHLTALTINLQVASRLSDGETKQKIEQCHGLSKLLLNDVREAVSTLRNVPTVNLRELLEIVIKDIPRLNVVLDIEEDIHLDDVNTAEALLRLTQEAITNTLKHTDAREAKIQVMSQTREITLVYSDSGSGCEQLQIGNGLQGINERLERLGGALKITTKPTFSLHAIVPTSH